jgi:hypothetical protein
MDDDEAFLASYLQVEKESLSKRQRTEGDFEPARPSPPAPAAVSSASPVVRSPLVQQQQQQQRAHTSPVSLSIWDRHRFAVGKNFPPALSNFFRLGLEEEYCLVLAHCFVGCTQGLAAQRVG